MSDLNAVTVLSAAFATLDPSSNRWRIRLIRPYRNVSAPFRKKSGWMTPAIYGVMRFPSP